MPETTLDQIAEHASPRVRQLIEILATRPELAGSALDELAATGTSATSAQPAVAWYLDHPDAAIKARAAQAAVAIGDRSPRVIESLQSMLATGESQAVQLASFLASDLGTQAEELSPSLEGLLVNGHAGVQISAAEALLRLNPDHPAAVQTLQRALRYGRPDQRWTAAAALGACTSTTHRVFVIDALTQALHDSDASVREAAALSLGGFGPAAQSAVPGLEESLQDPRTAVRSAARTALECITEQPQP